MTNEITPKQHIDIAANQSVNSVSKGKVSKPTWTAYDGYAREKAIQEARIQAMEEHALQQNEQHAVFETRRYQMLELALADVQKRLKALEGK